jgi:hypothetical protein
MMAKEASLDVTSNPAELSQVERVVSIFIAPSKTFRDILRSTAWWLPFVLVVAMSLASAFVIDKQVGYDVVVQNSMHDNPKQEQNMAEESPKQRAAEIHRMSIGFRYSSYASPVLILLISALGALGLWGSFNFGLGARTTFRQMFAVWMYASLPRLVAGLLMICTLIFGGDAEAFNPKNPVGTNLSFYLSDAAPWMKALLGYFDVIGIWVLALMVIGTAIVAGVKTGKAAAIVVGWWVIFLVATVGFTAMMT